MLPMKNYGCPKPRPPADAPWTIKELAGRGSMLKRFSIGVLCAGASMAAIPVCVRAADTTAEEPAAIQDIVVTGTRIKAPNLSSESPVTVVTDVEIKAEGATNIENVLNEIPQVHTAQSGGTSNNSTGVANVNLRGLGPTRTLVMIDGRRLGPGDPQGPLGTAADLNFIPTALVTGVDVLTGGASAVYGSGAGGGGGDFHLIRNFEGVQITQTFNKAQHTQGGPADGVLQTANYPVAPAIPGNQFDGRVSDTTLILGT